MKKYRIEIILGAVLSAVFLAFWAWQNPGAVRGKLTASEIDHYISVLDKQLPQTYEKKSEFLSRLRVWGETDNGRPVYMLNVMRYYDHLQSFPGGPDKGTPEEANAYYEKAVMPLIVKRGSYPMLAGNTERVREGAKPGSNLIGYDSDIDNWSRILVVRYPNRRAFLELISNPAYLQVMPYKMAALKLALVPVTGDIVIPDLPWVVGGSFLVFFLLVGWVRAARRRT